MGIMEIFTFVLMLCSVIQVVQNFNIKKKYPPLAHNLDGYFLTSNWERPLTAYPLFILYSHFGFMSSGFFIFAERSSRI